MPLEYAEFLHENILNSKLIALEDFGHASFLIEDAEKVNNIIWNFVKEHLDYFKTLKTLISFKL